MKEFLTCVVLVAPAALLLALTLAWWVSTEKGE